MSVTKTTRECYEVRASRRGDEWANITLACWDKPPQPGYTRTSMYYGGEIQIHSSFGSWGYAWHACGVPFKQTKEKIMNTTKTAADFRIE
jgi:hypothetical protein